MAFFGKESEAHKARADRLHNWAKTRSTYGLFSCLVAIIALLDFFTVVIGLILGSLAITLGVLGLNDIKARNGEITGRIFCKTGITLGALAILLSFAIAFYYFSI